MEYNGGLHCVGNEWVLIYTFAALSHTPRALLNGNSVPGDAQSAKQPNLQSPS